MQDEKQKNIKVDIKDIETASPDTFTSDSDASDSLKDIKVLLKTFAAVGSKNEDLITENRNLNEASTILNQLIKPYANRAYIFMCIYCTVVTLIIVAHGLKQWLFAHFFLPDNVLDFLVGSTAVTVIGLVGMVLTGIFVGARK